MWLSCGLKLASPAVHTTTELARYFTNYTKYTNSLCGQDADSETVHVFINLSDGKTESCFLRTTPVSDYKESLSTISPTIQSRTFQTHLSYEHHISIQTQNHNYDQQSCNSNKQTNKK